MNTRKKIYNIKKYYSPTTLNNYINDDCILDLFTRMEKNNYIFDDNYNIIKNKKRKNIDNNIDYDSFTYILEAGKVFEKDIIEKLILKMKENKKYNKFYDIGLLYNDSKNTNYLKNINSKYLKTMEILVENNYDIIINGILINDDKLGKPDLIVKGKWIYNYINNFNNFLKLEDEKYYIIDIKSSTINLINQGNNISESKKYNMYKVQVYFYTDLLYKCLKDYGIINKVDYSFILGKKYKYLSDNKEYILNSFDHLGIFNLDNLSIKNKNISIFIDDAIKWKKQFEIDFDKNVKNIKVYPPSSEYLHVNIKNNYDHGYLNSKSFKKIKLDIALANKEITLLPNCGVIERHNAFKHGICKYDDLNLTSDILGFNKNNSIFILIDKYLEFIKSNEDIRLNKTNNINNWQEQLDYEFYVDFETFNTDKYYDELNDNIYNLKTSLYMIGVGIFTDGKFIFKCFIQNYNNNNINDDKYIICKDETELINNFIEYIYSYKPKNINNEDFIKKMRLIHWSSAEPSLFNSKIIYYNINNRLYNLPWFDLLKVFNNRDNPILLKDCFNFKLKSIVKNMVKQEYFNIEWSDLEDGLISSFIAKDIYLDNITDVCIKNSKMKEIIEYNNIDCQVLYKILFFIRQYNLL